MVYIAGLHQAVDTGDSYLAEISKNSSVARQTLTERPLLTGREIHTGAPLEARAEYSRWIVDCPNCNSAEFAFEDNLFFCSVCHNSDVGGKVKRVIMPADRQEIEQALSERPIINRHWTTEESVSDLIAENRAFMGGKDGLDDA